jgi:thioredoxin-like negative regulator of GroEL
MEELKSQEDLEILLGFQPADGGLQQPNTTCIYFTAAWCGACKALDLDAILSASKAADPSLSWLKCDIDKNTYSAGYCGIRSIPGFVVIHKKKLVASIKSNKTEKVVAWLQTVLEDLH